MKKLILLTLISTAVLAGTVIFYDPNSAGISNRVVNIHFSQSPEKYSGISNVVVFNDWNDIFTNKSSDLKWDGNNVVLLTQQEKDTIVATNELLLLEAQKFSERNTKTNAITLTDDYLNSTAGRVDRAVIELLVAELNILRSQLNMARTNTIAFQSSTNRSAVSLADRTVTQAKNGIINNIQSQPDNQ